VIGLCGLSLLGTPYCTVWVDSSRRIWPFVTQATNFGFSGCVVHVSEISQKKKTKIVQDCSWAPKARLAYRIEGYRHRPCQASINVRSRRTSTNSVGPRFLPCTAQPSTWSWSYTYTRVATLDFAPWEGPKDEAISRASDQCTLYLQDQTPSCKTQKARNLKTCPPIVLMWSPLAHVSENGRFLNFSRQAVAHDACI